MIGVVAVVVLVVIDVLLDRFFRCPCRASRRWYYLPLHEAGWVMWGRAAFTVGLIVVLVLTRPETPLRFALLGGLVVAAVFAVRKAWFHSKERPGRFKGWAAGRVRVNAHGRLRVDPTG